MLREVKTYPAETAGAEWCLTERGAKDVLVNLSLLQAWGESGQVVIEEFNRGQVTGARESVIVK